MTEQAIKLTMNDGAVSGCTEIEDGLFEAGRYIQCKHNGIEVCYSMRTTVHFSTQYTLIVGGRAWWTADSMHESDAANIKQFQHAMRKLFHEKHSREHMQREVDREQALDVTEGLLVTEGV